MKSSHYNHLLKLNSRESVLPNPFIALRNTFASFSASKLAAGFTVGWYSD